MTYHTYIPTDTEFWDAGKTLKALAEGGYFTSNKDNSAEVPMSFFMKLDPLLLRSYFFIYPQCEWPETLKSMLSEG